MKKPWTTPELRKIKPRRVMLESPYAGDVKNNLRYARRCLLDSIHLGEAPFASHLLYTQVLKDTVDAERFAGISAGFAWGEAAEAAVFYVDRGWSNGMKAALERYTAAGIPIEVRRIYRRGRTELPHHDELVEPAPYGLPPGSALLAAKNS